MTGKIVQISGSIVDVEFESGNLPKINEALTVEIDGTCYGARTAYRK